MVGTKKMRDSKEAGGIQINVDGQVVTETSSEKLLGVVVNNTLTWKSHLYGDEENEGLVQQLSKRVGIIKMMAKHMKRENLKFFVSGIFYSKLNYCLPVYGNVLGLETYKEDNSRHQSYTTKDNNKLQVLQNSVNRVLLDARYDTPTEVLLRKTGSLSIQQMIAYHTTVLAYKIVKVGKPSYIRERLQEKKCGIGLRNKHRSIIVNNKKLAISREGFIYRAATLLNKIGEELRAEEKLGKFKMNLKKWILENISIKPRPKFQIFTNEPVRRPTKPFQPRDIQDIRNFFVDRSIDNQTTQTDPMQQRPGIPPPTPTDRPPPLPADTQLSIRRYFNPIMRSKNPREEESSSGDDQPS